jgi:hypothetical protein
MKFAKYAGNPILKPNPEVAWESLCVLNPAVVYRPEDGLFHMIYRAAGNDATHYIYLGYATSEDGVHFLRRSPTPLIAPDKDGADGGRDGGSAPRQDWGLLLPHLRLARFRPGPILEKRAPRLRLPSGIRPPSS